MDNKLIALIKSRKFWAALVGLVLLFVGDRAGLDQDTVTNAIYVIVSFILGTALESNVARG